MRDLSRLVPPGMSLSLHRNLFGWGSAAAVLYSFSFLWRYGWAREALFSQTWGVRALKPGAVMPDFAVLLRGAFLGFGVLALCFASLAAIHYAYHYQGSRSIYTMRRLPDPWELHRRCLAVPALGLVWCMICVLLLTTLYYVLYILVTP